MKKLLRGTLCFVKPIWIQVLSKTISKRSYLKSSIFKVTAIRGNKDNVRTCEASCTSQTRNRCRKCKGYFIVVRNIETNATGCFAAIDYKILTPEELGVKLL